MSKRSYNPCAQRTVNQINSTLDMLLEKELAFAVNKVPPVAGNDHQCKVTWFNHVPDRANGAKAFTKLEQYMHILDTNSYHCLLFDGAIIRVNFEFEDNNLVAQNLLWWPAPYDFYDLLREGLSPIDILMDLYGDKKWYETLKMRSPLRIDFDSANNTVDHPHSHMHIEKEETRLFTLYPICFNRFIYFIFRNFYPEYKIEFYSYDFIQYQTPVLENLDYRPSRIII